MSSRRDETERRRQERLAKEQAEHLAAARRRRLQALCDIHAHLAVYVRGRQALVPEGVVAAQVRQSADGPFASGTSCGTPLDRARPYTFAQGL